VVFYVDWGVKGIDPFEGVDSGGVDDPNASGG
jgi:hypothetical protein